MSRALNVFGLFFSLGGVLLLFLFGMPIRVETGGGTPVAWSTSAIHLQVKKFDDIYNALGWIGLLAIIFGTLLQAVAVLERK